MYVLTPEEMKDFDRFTIEELGVLQEILMENAGRSVYSAIKGLYEYPLEDVSAVVVAGRGNNGGDGLVVARYLSQEVDELFVYLIGKKADLKGSPLRNLEILEKMGIEIIEVDEIDEEMEDSVLGADIVVDALFGTGFRGKAEGIYAELIDIINASDAFIASVDIASGVNARTGEVTSDAVIADITVTMAFPKTGHFLYPGKLFTGELIVADIGIPRSLAEGMIKRATVEEDDVREILPVRLGNEHKGDVGRVLVIAGSRGFTGAASLTSMASMRMGAGLTYLAIPESLNPILEAKVTEVITLPVAEVDGSISEDAVDRLLDEGKYDSIAIGPGLSRKESAVRAVSRLLEKYRGPLVIDADGVWALKGKLELLKGREVPPILTPHPGELGHLLDLTPDEINRRRMEVASEFAVKHGVVLVLKGAPTVIGTPGGFLWINTTGNPGLASGGTGDVLTGMIASLLAQGVPPVESAIAGVYLHGLAGDLAAADLSEYSLMAGDLLDYIPDAINFLTGYDEEED
ncbi:MAG: NAD(P)H-hydrate dehydratase [Candidatus Hydrothermae bacterium]|nr:NAD(P)H-hydrate dehydratase [Candidatus Hydrothermae bacterium]